MAHSGLRCTAPGACGGEWAGTRGRQGQGRQGQGRQGRGGEGGGKDTLGVAFSMSVWSAVPDRTPGRTRRARAVWSASPWLHVMPPFASFAPLFVRPTLPLRPSRRFPAPPLAPPSPRSWSPTSAPPPRTPPWCCSAWPQAAVCPATQQQQWWQRTPQWVGVVCGVRGRRCHTHRKDVGLRPLAQRRSRARDAVLSRPAPFQPGAWNPCVAIPGALPLARQRRRAPRATRQLDSRVLHDLQTFLTAWLFPVLSPERTCSKLPCQLREPRSQPTAQSPWLQSTHIFYRVLSPRCVCTPFS